ncbi:MAG: DegT/DnrJ/EryC1/StrS family aminotransferase [Gammaproteobacteria bacterium]|nr:DegT/DnrJ/EryC1/StrS family aminotransferase [Gammaproteobacteria bacterium]
MFYQLSPVGNPIHLSRADQPEVLLQAFGQGYQPHYYASGTTALAAAIVAAIRLKPVDKPEVLLPAYGCPDLISAAVFAGAKPVLVDLEADRPWMDIEQLAEKTNTNTVAIIAVNLFGISERLAELRPFAERVGALLIEDSAQAFPSGKEKDIWQGDVVVLSFGRGKPVSLLGGGAVLCDMEHSRHNELAGLLPEGVTQDAGNIQKQILFRIKAGLYNGMINPRLYWLPQALPFLHLGETRYYPLPSLEGMDRVKLSMLSSNVKAYQSDLMSAQNKLAVILDGQDLEGRGIVDLPKACKITADRRLLRYPLLIEPEIRDQLHAKLLKLGLGPSRMYLKALPEISGLETLLSGQGLFPVAASFADRMLTLPTHSHVSQADIEKMCQVISN